MWEALSARYAEAIEQYEAAIITGDRSGIPAGITNTVTAPEMTTMAASAPWSAADSDPLADIMRAYRAATRERYVFCSPSIAHLLRQGLPQSPNIDVVASPYLPDGKVWIYPPPDDDEPVMP